jgi:hypothetical protein
MIAYIFASLNQWFENAERSRRDAYLAQSTNIAELEHRIRALEDGGYRVL